MDSTHGTNSDREPLRRGQPPQRQQKNKTRIDHTTVAPQLIQVYLEAFQLVPEDSEREELSKSLDRALSSLTARSTRLDWVPNPNRRAGGLIPKDKDPYTPSLSPQNIVDFLHTYESEQGRADFLTRWGLRISTPTELTPLPDADSEPETAAQYNARLAVALILATIWILAMISIILGPTPSLR